MQRFFFRAFLLCAFISAPAYAYIDPGTGMMFLQGLFAFVGAALTFIKKPWRMLFKFFRKAKDNDA